MDVWRPAAFRHRPVPGYILEIGLKAIMIMMRTHPGKFVSIGLILKLGSLDLSLDTETKSGQ